MKTYPLKAVGVLLGGTLLLQGAALLARAAIFDLNVQSTQFALYTDPYNFPRIYVVPLP